MKTITFLVLLFLASTAYADTTNLNKSRYHGVMVAPEPPINDIQDIVNCGVNLLRYQIYTDWNNPLLYSEHTYLSWLSSHLNHIDSLVPVLRGRTKLLLDFHVAPGGHPDVNNRLPLFYTPWAYTAFLKGLKQTAERFKHYPEVLGYDVLNEPQGSSTEALRLMKDAIATIRSVDTQKIISVSSPYGSPSRFKHIPSDPRLWYTFHFYSPPSFTGQGINGVPTGKEYPSGSFNKEKLRAQLKTAYDFSRKHRVRMFVGEYAASVFTSPNSRYRYLRDLTSLFQEHGFNYTMHAFREAPVWNLETSPKILPLVCKNPK